MDVNLNINVEVGSAQPETDLRWTYFTSESIGFHSHFTLNYPYNRISGMYVQRYKIYLPKY